MSFESNLDALLKTLCPRTFPDVAPLGTATPYMTWQQLGGESLRFLDNTTGDKRNVLLQINAWSKTRAEATALIRQIEEALCASALFIAIPEGEALSLLEDPLRGCVQRFSIYAAR